MKSSFNNHARLWGTGIASLIKAIVAERPDLAGAQFYVPKAGNSAYTVFAGGEVFKGPRIKGEEEAFRREMGLHIKLSAAKVPLIPQVTMVSATGSFYAVRRMAGSHPSYAFMDMISDARGALAYQMGQIMAQAAQAAPLYQGAHVREAEKWVVKGVALMETAVVREFLGARAGALADAG